jgi:glucuronosyltransferase
MLLLAVGSIDAYKILLLIPFPGPSHFLMFKVLIRELVSRGHEVTSISAFPFNEELANYTEIKIEPTFSFGDGCELI